ncbi:putative DD34D transposase [Trichonephila clavipes]|nr:putative DD34D transposase [Trichonephila clavipes]
MNRLKPFPKPMFTKKGDAVYFGGILKDSFFSFYRITINSEVYCHQLDKLNNALQQKRSKLINIKGLVFHQDNAAPHTSLFTRQKLLQLEWDTMPQPTYSPDLVPTDYLFRSLGNFLDCKPSPQMRSKTTSISFCQQRPKIL